MIVCADVAASDSSQTIEFGSARIRFELTHSSRKRLKISVHPDLRVTVEAPEGRLLEDVLRRVRRRADWVVRQLDYFERFQPLPTPREYISGETHVYLGRQYRLKVVADEREWAKMIRGYFEVHVRDRDNTDRVRRSLTGWFNEHGKAVVSSRLAQCYEVLRRSGVPEPKSVVFRRMAKRWGSCGKSGVIMLNTELAKAPVHCIDYVIIHELCHLKYRNHSKEFFALLTACMPDWERRKERLERVVI